MCCVYLVPLERRAVARQPCASQHEGPTTAGTGAQLAPSAAGEQGQLGAAGGRGGVARALGGVAVAGLAVQGLQLVRDAPCEQEG